MAFPKKKSRKIEVNGNPYYWICSRSGEYSEFRNNISVMAANITNSKKIFANIDYASYDFNLFQCFPISPYIIKQIIELGIQKGYDPLNGDSDLNLGEVSDAIILNQETKLKILLNHVTKAYQESKFDKDYSMFKNNDQYVEDITTQVNTYIENEEWMSGFKYLEKMIVDLDLAENTQIIGFIERVRREESL
ncbi:hypothetical protein [Dokdonia sp.]|uniref:hypothetical protein n=1 Tax=Dokdonia sp. TaxID=2024995 RepID=UPI0032647072